MHVLLRQAKLTDAAGIADVYLASRKTFLPFAPPAHSDVDIRQWIADVLIPSGGVIVVTRANELIGMMALSRDGAFGWDRSTLCSSVRCGRGIGTLLIERARQALGSRIRLYTFQANTGSRRFYERHGFRPIAFSDGHANEERCPDVLYEFAGELAVNEAD
jgi:RimJ/RimL family protein N-acetyltransferase